MSAHIDAPLDARTLVDIARFRAAATPDELAYRFLIDGELEGPGLTYSQLDRQARAIARNILKLAGPGDRAILLYEPGIEFIPALLGCFYAGVVAVPAYPPRLDRLAQGWTALSRLVADCTPAIGLSTADLMPLFEKVQYPRPGGSPLPWLATNQVVADDGLDWNQPVIDPNQTAFLQYTSGSTNVPRGVIVTHANLLHNERMWEAAAEHSGPGLGVCWLPLHHDMGLIGGVLQGLYHGSPIIMMSPLSMLQRPARWLAAISKYRADTSGGPNFAYDLCVNRISVEEKRDLDLSKWSIACIGAEPINPGTLARFTEAFASCGFRAEAFYPSYGLAEGTLFVAGGAKSARPIVRSFSVISLEMGTPLPVGAEDSEGRTLVGCGHAWMGQTIAIVDPATCARLLDGKIGEVWVHGPSVAQGYWNRTDETEQTFAGQIVDDSAKPYLRTGDLGFLLEGELFVTGRCKEVLIIRGRNYYPQDLEATVQARNPAFKPGAGAAFEVSSGESSKLVIAQELDRKLGRGLDLPQLAGDIRQAVAEAHALQVHDVVFLEPGSLPKTTSGKIQRYVCRREYEANALRRWKQK
ncbi:fatty acyl-AMP ligase [soil metagenome]